MPRLPADPVGRLAKLEAVRAELKPKTVLNAAELAQVLGISWRFLKQMIDEDPTFPVKVRGDMGVPWEFDARKVVDHLIKQARTAQVERERRSARVSRLAGLGGQAAASSLGGEPAAGSGTAVASALTVSDLGKLVQVNREFQRAKMEQGQLVDAEAQEQAVIAYNSAVQAAIMDSAQHADPTGTWPPEIRAAWENAARTMLVMVQDAATRWVNEIRRQRT